MSDIGAVISMGSYGTTWKRIRIKISCRPKSTFKKRHFTIHEYFHREGRIRWNNFYTLMALVASLIRSKISASNQSTIFLTQSSFLMVYAFFFLFRFNNFCNLKLPISSSRHHIISQVELRKEIGSRLKSPSFGLRLQKPWHGLESHRQISFLSLSILIAQIFPQLLKLCIKHIYIIFPARLRSRKSRGLKKERAIQKDTQNTPSSWESCNGYFKSIARLTH